MEKKKKGLELEGIQNMTAWYTDIFLLVRLQLPWPQGSCVAADEWVSQSGSFPTSWQQLHVDVFLPATPHIPAVLPRSRSWTEEPGWTMTKHCCHCLWFLLLPLSGLLLKQGWKIFFPDTEISWISGNLNYLNIVKSMTLYFTRFTFSTSQLCRLAMVFIVTHLNIRKILEIINDFEWWGL